MFVVDKVAIVEARRPSEPLRGSLVRVLLVEDDKKIASFVEEGLQQAGFGVDRVDNGEDGLELALRKPYDIAVIDIMLPRLDGLAVVEAMRQSKVVTPVIILSAKRSVDDRVRGLQLGSDDYLTKPFAFSELLARVQAVIRRTGPDPTLRRLVAGDLTVNLATREVTRGGRRLDLQPREYALLEYLLRNAGRPLSKAMILEALWNYSFDPQTNVVEVLVCRLRGKIDDGEPVKLIHTLRGVGYVLKTP
jgi:two-component system, OmpR family, response regulator